MLTYHTRWYYVIKYFLSLHRQTTIKKHIYQQQKK